MMPSTVEGRLSQLEGRVQEQSISLAEVRELFRHLDRKIDDFRTDLQRQLANQFRWTIGIMLTILGVLLNQ